MTCRRREAAYSKPSSPGTGGCAGVRGQAMWVDRAPRTRDYLSSINFEEKNQPTLCKRRAPNTGYLGWLAYSSRGA